MQTTRPPSEAEVDVVADSDTDSLPDQLINPGEYELVLPTTVKKELDPRRPTPVYTYGL